MTQAGADINEAIIRVARRHRQLAGVLLGELGLHPGQDGVLRLLAERDRRSQAELASALGIEPPTVHRMLGTLERAGVLRRVPSPRDGRVTLVELTDEGWALLPRLARVWEDLRARTVDGLDEHDARTLHRLLVTVAENLVARPPDDHP